MVHTMMAHPNHSKLCCEFVLDPLHNAVLRKYFRLQRSVFSVISFCKEKMCSDAEKHGHKNVLNNYPWVVEIYVFSKFFPLCFSVFCIKYCFLHVCFKYLKEIGKIRALWKKNGKSTNPRQKRNEGKVRGRLSGGPETTPCNGTRILEVVKKKKKKRIKNWSHPRPG